MRRATRATMGLLLLASLAACDRSAGTDSPVAEAAAATAAPVAPAPMVPATNAADAGLAIAVARETADRAVREQTLRVQQQLREQERVREAAVRALNSGNDRCIDGQKLRRVGNGWVQAGTC